MYVVTVTFLAVPDRAEDFLTAMRENARASVEREPGCLRFDVCTSPDDAARVFLYEIYTDRAAFDAHLAAPHYLEFNDLVADWTAEKFVQTFELVAEGVA